MNRYYTSIEESKKLIELGLKAETADMHYLLIGNIDTGEVICADYCPVEVGKPYNNLTLPCWSAEALLNLMPPYLFEWDRGIDLLIYPHLNKKKGWLVSYIPNNVEYMQKDKFRQICHADTLVEACYNMIVWLLQNNYIKTE